MWRGEGRKKKLCASVSYLVSFFFSYFHYPYDYCFLLKCMFHCVRLPFFNQLRLNVGIN